jgi:hypothetical protein
MKLISGCCSVEMNTPHPTQHEKGTVARALTGISKTWAVILQPYTSATSTSILSSASIKIAMASTADEAEAEKYAQWRAEQIRQLRLDSRFSLPFGMRLPLATSLSFVAGMALGLSHGSQTAGLRFRAENAHRLPQTPTGWYLYHKTKNYHMALGGVKEGLKMGAKISIWTGLFFSIEEMFDRYRGTKDFINTVIASLSVAGGFSLFSMSRPLHTCSRLTTTDRFPLTTAARTAKSGLAVGLVYGLVQDALGAAKGRRPGYVDFILRKGRRKADMQNSEMA